MRQRTLVIENRSLRGADKRSPPHRVDNRANQNQRLSLQLAFDGRKAQGELNLRQRRCASDLTSSLLQ